VRHCRSRIIQASIWTILCKHHWKYFVRGGLRRTTTFKQQENNAACRSTLPESCETLTHQERKKEKKEINLIGLVKKESKTGAYRYRHDRYWDTPGLCYTFHLDVVSRSVYIHEIMIMSRRERKLDRVKMNSKGATNEALTCAVPMHAPQTNSLWQGVGEVSSACEVGC